jgi:hypothetical protein
MLADGMVDPFLFLYQVRPGDYEPLGCTLPGWLKSDIICVP